MKYTSKICSVLLISGLLATLPACNDKKEENKAKPATEVKQEEAKQEAKEEAKQEEPKKEETIVLTPVTEKEKKALGLTDDLEDSIGLSAMGIDPNKPSTFTDRFEEEGPIGLNSMDIDPAGPESIYVPKEKGKITKICDAVKNACSYFWWSKKKPAPANDDSIGLSSAGIDPAGN